MKKASWTVLAFFAQRPPVFEIWPFFNLVLRYNRGVSFSMFHSNGPLTPWILTAVALAICGIVVHWMYMETDRFNVLFFGFVLGGALGNVVDRIRFGAVVDFLDFHIGQYAWPAFNFADSAICVGAVCLLIYNLFIDAPPKPETAPSSQKKESE